METKAMVEVFAVCSRLLNQIVLRTKDKFFSDLFSKETDKLLSGFVNFLKAKGDSQNLKPSRKLIFQIKNVLNLLEILKHLELTEPTTPLLLEKNLLLLESAILKSNWHQNNIPAETNNHDSPLKKIKTRKKFFPQNNLGETHNRILEMVRSKERVQNLEIFNHLSNISKRTLKRKLSELIKARIVKRRTDGKKVFYVAV